MSLVSLVVWKDAVKDPPEEGRGEVWTDNGAMSYFAGAQPPATKWSNEWGAYEPSVWCDPIPPTKDALTVEDVRGVMEAAASALHPADEQNEPYRQSLARLRAALPEGGDE
jgi:hypothetical protein